MVVTDKVKALLALTWSKNSQLANYFGISPQSMNNKMNRGSFSAEDLIRIAEFADCQLLFELDSGQRIYLRMKDERSSHKDERSSHKDMRSRA